MVFDVGEKIGAVDAEGAQARVIVDPDPENEWLLYEYRHTFGYHVDVSPDGSRIVYASCEFPFPHEGYWYPAANELAIANVDGTGRQRLTINARFEGYPTWSPDGSRIAYIRTDDYLYDPFESQIVIMSADGVKVVPNTKGVGLYPPVWSPDGERLAFTVNEAEEEVEYPRYPRSPYKRILYVVGVDGSGLSRIGEATTLPAWSPDGESLAFGFDDGQRAAVHTVRFDGMDLSRVLDDFRANQVSWSPDGADLLLASDAGVHVVRKDGSVLRALGPPNLRVKNAIWSPDGSTIAARHELRTMAYYSSHWVPAYWESLVVSMNRDGSDVQFLAEGILDDGEPKLRATPKRPSPRMDPAACSAGVVIPTANAGLVNDCRALMRASNALIPNELGWTADTPLAEWPGVGVYGDPPRVRELVIRSSGLRVVIPPEIGELYMLKELDLSNNNLTGISPELGKLTNLVKLDLSRNDLTGIPPELGSLRKLRVLDLSENNLRGPIPPELGNLGMLEMMDLAHNRLSGIPPELGNLTMLRVLNLVDNSLSGAIPPELGNLTMLRELDLSLNLLTGGLSPALGNLTLLEKLDLSNNRLGGPIPPELGELTNLRTLTLFFIRLSGPIPPELGNLTMLKVLDFGYNSLSGAIPAELGKLTMLETLDLGSNKLSGTIPPELGSLTMLRNLDLRENDLSGCVPVELSGQWIRASKLERCRSQGDGGS